MPNIDWELSEEIKSIIHFCKNDKISIEELDIFIEKLINNAAARSKMDKRSMKELIIQHNSQFFTKKSTLFSENSVINVCSAEFQELCSMFLLPKIEGRRKAIMILESKKTASDCIEMFNSLTNEEKVKFIIEFEKAQINLNPLELLRVLKS